MNKRQLEVLKTQNLNEKKILRFLKRAYQQASRDCEAKIRELAGRTDMENLQSIIYQQQYQEALKKQLDGILDTLQNNEFESIAEYLTKCYEDGFIGTLYDLHGQGIPLILPIDQTQVVKAVQTDSKISSNLYNRLGEDITYLKKSIRVELSRGVSNGSTWAEMATYIAHGMNSPFRKAMNCAMRIARTEGHRIQNEAQWDTLNEARGKGADVVKQWDSTLDSRTRPTHQILDGQIREIDDYFEVNGHRAKYPGGFGVASEDIHCRCCMLQRAKWALDQDELNTLKERATYFGLDKTAEFEEFKSKYIIAIEEEQQYNDDRYYPELIADIKRGKPMDFAGADSGNVNPLYGTSPGYSINCQACVVTFEARQRGYDVRVLPNTKGSMLEKLSRKTNLAWIDLETGEHPEYIFDNKKIYTAKTYKKYLENIIEQGKRYTIEFGWKGRSRSGHIVNIDRTDAGELRIKDNQRGMDEKSEWIGDKEISHYLSRLKYSTSIYGTKYSTPPKVLRIDNAGFDIDVVEKIMEGSGRK